MLYVGFAYRNAVAVRGEAGMIRSGVAWWSLMALAILVPAVHLQGQERTEENGGEAVTPVRVLGVETLALAKFAASRADPRTLARQMRDAAEIDLTSRMLEFLAGRGTLDILLAASRRLLDAEQAVLGEECDNVALAERHWELNWLVETVNQTRYEVGRIAIQDFL
jgi:hypothetical protein